VTIDVESYKVISRSRPSDYPSLIRQKKSSIQTVERHEVDTEARTTQTCQKCGRTEVRYTAVQLRSADEGTTVFYTCDCGNKYVNRLQTLCALDRS
jgi:DNA-directed RNA polymerase I subunit RPA12